MVKDLTLPTEMDFTQLKIRFVCTACRTKNVFGDLLQVATDRKHPWGIACPACRSGHYLQMANGGSATLPQYHGDIPELLH